MVEHNINEIIEKVSVAIARDKSLLQKFTTDSHATFKSVTGVTLPKNVTLKLHLAKTDESFFVVPPRVEDIKVLPKDDLHSIYKSMFFIPSNVDNIKKEIENASMNQLVTDFFWEDANFRKEVSLDPKVAIKKKLGFDLPSNFKYKLIQCSKEILNLPVYPISSNDALSEASLDKVAGGRGAINWGALCGVAAKVGMGAVKGGGAELFKNLGALRSGLGF